MQVKVTLEFDSAAAAIVALSKIDTTVAKVVERGETGEAASKPRKPRNDAGKKRGSYKAEAAQPSSPQAPAGDAATATGTAPAGLTTDTAPSVQPESAEAAASPAPAENTADSTAELKALLAEPITLDEVKEQLTKLVEAKGVTAGMEVLKSLGVARVSELSADKYAVAIAKMQEAM